VTPRRDGAAAGENFRAPLRVPWFSTRMKLRGAGVWRLSGVLICGGWAAESAAGAAAKSAAEVAAANAERPALAAIAWLAGTWTLERNGRETTEHWEPLRGGTMIGLSRTVAGERTVAHEFLLLRTEADGTVNYVARPSGQKEAAFRLVRASATEAVFENPAHDFPQRISYTLQAEGKLTAAIEGTRNGQGRRVEFPYVRQR
jgi:hypothetical protein